MTSGGRSRAAAGGGAGEPVKRRRVAATADAGPVSCSANECLKLHIVLSGQELEGQNGDEEYTCDPEFAERIFGEEGTIYGYVGLKIDLWLHAATLHAYVQIQYTSKSCMKAAMFNNATVNPQSAGGKKTPCTDVLAKLKEAFGDGLTEDRELFQQSLPTYSNDFRQMLEKHGEVVSSWRSEADSSPPATEEDTKADSISETPDRLKGESADAAGEIAMPDQLDKENANVEVDSEMLDKENANAEVDSEMPDKENANADSNIELPDKDNEEITNADSNSEVPDEPKEENTNRDNDTELADKPTEESTNRDNDIEILDKPTEESTDAVSNSEVPVKPTEESTTAVSNSEVPDKLKQIVRVELADADVRAWHARLTPLSLLYIEGAQPIESDDPLWEVYLALEGEGSQMRVAGFCNVYRFYHYPDSTRLRISQILVLPPYQGDGFGLHLLQAINTAAIARNCYDVTMEEPSMVLQKLRDTMDVLRLLALPSIDGVVKDAVGKLQAKKEAALRGDGSEGSAGDKTGALVNFDGSCADAAAASQSSQPPGAKEKSLLAPPGPLVEEARKALKVSKMQFKRCWEQLLFLYLDPKDRDLQDVFQAALVERFNAEIFEKESSKTSVGKRVIDIDNEYDNSKTFIMIRKRKFDAVDGNGNTGEEGSDAPSGEVAALVPGPEEKAKVLGEELQQRQDDMRSVAQTVAGHCRTLGLNFPSMNIWEQVDLGTVEQAAT